MASFYGTDYNTSFVSVTSGSGAVGTMKAGGRVRAIVDTYTAGGTETNGDWIYLGGSLVEDGAQVIDAWLSHSAITGVSAKLTVQSGGSPSDIIGATALGTAGVVRFGQGNLPTAVSHTSTGDGAIYAPLTAGTMASGDVIAACVFYMID